MTLTMRRLNRATLARQLLLRRNLLGVVDGERVGERRSPRGTGEGVGRGLDQRCQARIAASWVASSASAKLPRSRATAIDGASRARGAGHRRPTGLTVPDTGAHEALPCIITW